MRRPLGVWGMGGSPHSNSDENSLERGAQPEASTASEGSDPAHDAKTQKHRDANRRQSLACGEGESGVAQGMDADARAVTTTFTRR